MSLPEICTPDWVKHAVFYQVFPDRFARGQQAAHPAGIKFQEWGSKPTKSGYQGGDLYGLAEKLDYLADLGITAIYLCPIFSSASNHRYHTYDYLEVDPLLGGDAALRHLLDTAHARDIRIVLDGVFNHTGRGFWAFHHILENGGESPYIDWFHVHSWPLHPYPSNRQHPNYDCWWGLPDLPKLNTDCQAVRDHIFEVAKYWIDFGIDGWRLDVPSEIDDDSFWQEFRQVVKGANPEAYIVGEIWGDATRWLQGDQFDAVMNYLFTGPTISFFAAETLRQEFHHDELYLKPLDAKKYSRKINKMLRLYDDQINQVQLNLLDSHDMPRLAWLARDRSAVQMAMVMQMTMPGAPCVYYGTEVGLTGGKDPDCRRAFPWHDEASWDNDLHQLVKTLIALRKEYEVLRIGDYKTAVAEENLFGFTRSLQETKALVLFNTAKEPFQGTLELKNLSDGEWQSIWPATGKKHVVNEQIVEIELPARSALVLLKD